MIKHFSSFQVLVILVLCSLSNVRGQELPMAYLGIENGLSNNAVTCIFQDHHGFMWFGTYDGLNSYNGYEFKVFRNQLDDSSTLIHNRIVAINEDKENRVWVGTKKGLSIFDPVRNSFSPLYYRWESGAMPKKITCTINDIQTDGKVMYIATAGIGLLSYKKGEKYAHLLPVGSKGLNSSSANKHVQAVSIDEKQRLWVFIQGEGLYLHDEKRKCLNLINSSVSFGNTLKSDGMGHLWLGSDIGLYVYDTRTNTYSYKEQLRKSLAGSAVVGLNITKDKELWIATDGAGVIVLSLKTGHISYLNAGESKGSLKSRAVYATYVDVESRKWIGTLRGGINVIGPAKDKFSTIVHQPGKKNSLINNFVLSFCETPEGNLWIGTDGGGLSFWDRKINSYRNYKHDPANKRSLVNDNVTGILRDAENNIWICTYGGGICKYIPETDDFEQYSCYNGIYKYLNNNVWLLFEDRFKHLLAGTVNGAIYYLNKRNNRFEVYDNTLTNVISFAEDKQGNLWAGTFSELIKVDRTHRKNTIYTVNFPVRAIHPAQHRDLWLGTEGGGLRLFDTQSKSFRIFTEKNGLSSNSILNILEDKRGNLWLSSFNGLTYFNVKNKRTRSYYESDGLQSNQFNYNAALIAHDGEFLFGGIKGFNLFHPDSLQSGRSMPETFIIGMRINNLPYQKEKGLENVDLNQMQHIELPHDKTMLSIDYVALEYSAADKIRYAYYMEGWDNAWNYVGKVRSANYSRLNEGTYLLRIRSTNAEGTWNTQERTLKITILPPWYRTWFAYACYVALLCGLVYLIIYYKTWQARLKFEVKIAHLNVEKEKELNEKKLSFFTNVSHEFRSPLTLIINPIKEVLFGEDTQMEVQQLNIVYRNARRLLSLVDQLLLFTKADSDADILKITKLNIVAVCKEVFMCFSHQAASNRIDYEIECNSDEIMIYADREKVEIILFNLLSNALKFTADEGYVRIKIVETLTGISISVENDGSAIPADIGMKLFDKYFQINNNGIRLKSGFGIGLYLVKNFVEQHQGKIGYVSSKSGTVFTVELKKGNDHFPEFLVSDVLTQPSSFLNELLIDEVPEIETAAVPVEDGMYLFSEKDTLLVIDDNKEIRDFIRRLFHKRFRVFEADNASTGLEQVKKYLPGIVICDIVMAGDSGIDLCTAMKKDSTLCHIPLILLTGTDSADIKMKGFESGADDYITKPFESEMLITRVNAILKRQDNLQQYFYNKITHKADQLKISDEHRVFLERCIEIIEQNLVENEFSITVLASKLGMSHSSLYKHVKVISGQSISSFIRFIRLRKAAELFIDTNCNVSEVAFMVGFNDVKYFREQFFKLFEYNPSEYIKKYRKTFNQVHSINEKLNPQL